MGRPKGSKRKITNFIDLIDKPVYKEEKPEPVKKKAPPILIMGKRSTKMMYEVLPWAKSAKYIELRQG